MKLNIKDAFCALDLPPSLGVPHVRVLLHLIRPSPLLKPPDLVYYTNSTQHMAGVFCRELGRIRCNNILTCRKRVLCRICVYLRNSLVIFILASSKNKNTGKQQTASCNHRCINKLAYLFILLKDKSVFYGSAFLIIFMYFPYS